MFKFIPLIKKFFALVSIVFSLFFTLNAFCDDALGPDPQVVFNKCNTLNTIGNNAQNKPQMLIGCWRATSSQFKTTNVVGADTSNITYPPETPFFLLASYLIFDADGSQYSCVSNQNMAWNTYQDLDKFNFTKLFDGIGRQVQAVGTTVTFPTLNSQQITIDTGTSGNPSLKFTYVRDIGTSNNAGNDLLVTNLLTPLPPAFLFPFKTVCKNINIFSNSATYTQ